MPFDLTSACIALAGALVGGVLLGYAVATRTARRRTWYAALWLWMVMSLVAARWPGLPVVEALGGMPLVALCASMAFEGGCDQRNAARSMGAAEWRIFWRVMLPAGWRGIAGGAMLVLIRAAAERAIVAAL